MEEIGKCVNLDYSNEASINTFGGCSNARCPGINNNDCPLIQRGIEKIGPFNTAKKYRFTGFQDIDQNPQVLTGRGNQLTKIFYRSTRPNYAEWS